MKKKLIVLSIASALFGYNAHAQSTTTTTTIQQTTTTPATETVTPPAPAAVQTPPAAAPAPQDNGGEKTSKFGVPRFYIGTRVLGSVTNFKINTSENNNVSVAKTSATLGYGFGGYVGANLTKNFALQLEVMYNTLSQKYVDKGLDRRIDVSYINIPLMLVLNTNISKPVNFNITAGPQVGINVGAKIKGKSSGDTEIVNTKFAVKPTDFGVAYGAGLDFRVVPALSVGVGYRGVTGLVDISDKNSTATYSTTQNGVTTTHTVVVLDKSKVTSHGAYVGLRLNF